MSTHDSMLGGSAVAVVVITGRPDHAFLDFQHLGSRVRGKPALASLTA